MSEAILFIHIPKTAGSSIRGLIAQNYLRAETFAFSGLPDSREWFFRRDAAFRRTLRLIHGHHPYGLHREMPQPCRYFTFLREPVARYFSDYFFAWDYPQHVLHDAITRGRLSLADYGDLCRHDPAFDNLMTQYLAGRLGEPVSADTLALALRHLTESLERFGLAERFDESLLCLARRFGWRRPFYVAKNRSRETLADVPAALQRRVSDRLAYDRELYACAVALFERHLAAEPPSFPAALAHYRTIEKDLHRDYDRLRHRLYTVEDGIDRELVQWNTHWDQCTATPARFPDHRPLLDYLL